MHNIPPELPCCGVAVLCHLMDRDFHDVFSEVNSFFKKPKNWYGSMTLPEFLLTLIDNGYDIEEYESHLTLEQYVNSNNDSCVINVPNHFQLYKNGLLHDQYGSYPIEKSMWKDEKITKIIKIL